MLLVDHEIRKLCLCETYHNDSPMIEPFSEAVSGGGVISYGLTHAGYDVRLAGDVLVFNNAHGQTVDPKRFKDLDYRGKLFASIELSPHQAVVIPAHGYILGRTHEYLRVPNYLSARCVGKSTLARCGIIVNTTPLEPGWEGHLTVEISNSCPCPAVVYVMEGVAQIQFERLSATPEKSYADKKGKYQGQTGVTTARVE